MVNGLIMEIYAKNGRTKKRFTWFGMRCKEDLARQKLSILTSLNSQEQNDSPNPINCNTFALLIFFGIKTHKILQIRILNLLANSILWYPIHVHKGQHIHIGSYKAQSAESIRL